MATVDVYFCQGEQLSQNNLNSNIAIHTRYVNENVDNYLCKLSCASSFNLVNAASYVSGFVVYFVERFWSPPVGHLSDQIPGPYDVRCQYERIYEYIRSVSKIIHSKVTESPVTRVEPEMESYVASP